MACWAEPHWRSTVVPGTVSGNPAASAALRPMFMACSPTVMVHPMTTSSTRAGSRSLRSTRALSGAAARSTACQPDNLPLRRPTRVRTASTITALGIADLLPSIPALRLLPNIWRCVRFRFMDLRYTAEQERFRAEVRDWLEAHVPSASRGTGPLPSLDTAEGFEAHRAWERVMYEARWTVVSWPEEFGGRGAGLLEWIIFEEEYYRAQAPTRVGQNGIFLLAPTLFEFGTPEQKARYLPAMASGEEIWCQGWSEPDAGSDLASLRSTSTKVDGGWLLNGQKTWASRGAFAEWCFGLFRSDPDAERHRGLTYFLIDMATPGVTVRPIPQIDGETGFAELFFEDVFVPDEQVLGGVGQGWSVAMATAGSERGLS